MPEEYNTDNIQVLPFPQAVRKRPRLYFTKCFDENSLDALPLEACCHAIDEHYDGNCHTIQISLQADNFSIRYDAGMSLEDEHGHGMCPAESIMVGVFACRNEKKHLSVGEEFCELGIATINMAAETCELITVSQGQKGRFTFAKGELLSRHIEPWENEAEYTQITMKPDATLFEGLSLNYEGIREKAELLMTRLPKLAITVINEQND